MIKRHESVLLINIVLPFISVYNFFIRATLLTEYKHKMKFSDLGLNENTLKAVADVGYEEPTPIQAKAIPEILKRNDVMGIAQTGTGKTAAFTLPMIDILANGRAKALMPRTLILSPTRELATQIAECFQKYGKYQKLSMALLIGGESMIEQQKILSRGVDVLIATPGRMIDLCERGRILLRDVQVFVLDEADRMLDMGFIPDVEKSPRNCRPCARRCCFPRRCCRKSRLWRKSS